MKRALFVLSLLVASPESALAQTAWWTTTETDSPAVTATLICPKFETALARPIPMGVSIGDVNDTIGLKCGAGTAGAVVFDSSGNQSVLTNNHVGASDFVPPIVPREIFGGIVLDTARSSRPADTGYDSTLQSES
jgi:hypothetical protein